MNWTITEQKPHDALDWYCGAWGNKDAIFVVSVQTLDDMEYHWGPHLKISF